MTAQTEGHNPLIWKIPRTGIIRGEYSFAYFNNLKFYPKWTADFIHQVPVLQSSCLQNLTLQPAHLVVLEAFAVEVCFEPT